MPDSGDLADAGWRLDVDAEAGQLRFEHVDSGEAYAFDDDGDLIIPGEGGGGGDVEASALDASAEGALDAAATGTGVAGIRCDEETGELIIESDTAVSMAAPTIDVSGEGLIEIFSPGGVTVSGGGDASAPDLGIRLPDGSIQSVAPIEGDGTIAEFYGFDEEVPDSAGLPDDLTVADATVTFLYRNGSTGDLSLAVVHDDPSSGNAGSAVLTYMGVSGYEWLVQDGPPGNDAYETPNEPLRDAETAAWTWPGDVTDGGAIGPLGESFAVDVTHRTGGTVNDTTVERSGIDRWLFVDGSDRENPIEVVDFTVEPRDVMLQVFTGQPESRTPASLQLWLRPGAGIETVDGAVATWADQSGNGFDFTQEDPAKRPTLVEDATNGLPALRFDGEDDHFVRRDTLGMGNDAARTYVVVCRLSDLEARSPYLMQGRFDATGNSSNSYGLEANTYNTTGERFGLYLISVAKDSERSTNDQFNVHTLRTGDFSNLSAMEETTDYFLNGQQVAYQDTSGGVRNEQFDGDSTAIGTFPQSSPGALMHGDIAEIFVFDRAVGDEFRSSLEGALMEKYGIAPPT